MKRSEMLSKIAACIINHNEPHRYTDRETALQIAEIILQVQEEAGMLPPESSRSIRLGMFDLQHTRYAHVWDENDWDIFSEEPEDET